MEQTRPAQTETTPVADAGSPPSSAQPEQAEAGFFDQLIRGVGRSFGFGRPPQAPPEDEEPTDATAEAAAAPAWTPPASKDEFDRSVQSEVDRREAKRARQAAEEGQARYTAQEWERVKDLARKNDTWALGEIAKAGVDLAISEEERDGAYGEFLKANVPLFDKAFLDPLLERLPEEVWKPIVGEGLTTLEDRTAAVGKALAAHRERAVADALEDPAFVRKLLGSQAFRAAWLKSDVVRKQYLANLRGDPGYEEADLAPGVARGAVSGNEEADMDAILRGQYQALRATRHERMRSARNGDL